MPGPLQLLPALFLTTSTTKQMRPKGKGGLNQVEGLYQECYSGLAATSGSDSIINIVRARRLGLFGHVARFSRDVPASNILSICCASGDGYPPDPSWRRLSGRSRTTWLDHISSDTGMSLTEIQSRENIDH